MQSQTAKNFIAKNYEKFYNALNAITSNEFSSFDFTDKLREQGFSDRITGSGVAAEFLKTTTMRVSNKTWRKNANLIQKPKQLTIQPEFKAQPDSNLELEAAIKLVKANGLRVFKPNTELVEI